MSTITQFPSGNTQYRIEFDYLARTFVVVTLVNSSNPTMNRVLEVGRDYRFLNPTIIEMLVDQSGFDIVRIHRQTGTDLVVDFRNGSVLTASDLTNAELQAIHIAEEGRDQTVDLAKEYADAAGSSAGNAKDSEDEARRIAERIKAAGLVGYITRRSFEKGFNVTTWNEVLLWEEDGEYYRWDGTLPKNVPEGSTPETAGGVGLGAWISVGDASLRGSLMNNDGAELIGINPSGKLADVLNDVTPEQFGAIGDGVADDTQALKAMFKYINDMPISFTDTATELNPRLDVVAKRVVLRGLYMHTETIFIPPGVQIVQPGYSYFRRIVQQGFYFNPPSGEGNMAAVSTYVYLKSGATWSLNSDPMFLPTGAQIDSGEVRTGARHIDIENLSIITKPGTLLALRWLGAAGCTTRNLSIGENTPGSTASTARIPKVGMLHSIAWGSVHTTPKILYKTQGAVFYEQNGGSEVKNAYIARLGQDSTYSEQVIFKPEDFDETGDVAITQYGRSSVQFRYCVTETCSFMYVNQGDARSNGGLKVDGCHMEATGGKAKHCFYIINSDADIRLNGLFIQDASIANSSVVYVKNCVKGRSVVDIHGYMMVNGYRFLDGIDSGAVVNIRNPNNGQFQYGKLGKWDLVNEVTGVSPSTLYIDPVNGNDENWGFHGARGLKSLKHAAKICRMLGINDVYTNAGSISLTEDTELPSATIRGLGGIVCNSSGSLIALRKTNVNLTLNGGVTSPAGYHLIKVATTEPVNVVSTGDMTTTTSANIFLFQANGNVEWTHKSGGTLACYRYAGTQSTTYSGVIGLNIRATTRPAIDSTPVSGNVVTKYSSILNS